MALLRNALANLAQWCRDLVRPPTVTVQAAGTGRYVVVVVTLIAVVASMFLLDAAASTWARGLPRWWVAAFEHITDLGLSGWFLFPAGFALLCLAAVTSPIWSPMTQDVLVMLTERVGFVFLAIGAPGLFAAIVKRMIGRARPYVGPRDNPFDYIPFVWRPEYASMPSGHATTAAAAAVAIGAVWPVARGVMWIYALLIMFSRVVVLEHHPSDVLAGALVGVVGADLVRRWFAARSLLFSASDLKAMPGPFLSQIWQAIAEIIRGKSR
jgi:undecaprenyl-diphosphatase